jgi:hypothetical protein
MICSYVGKNERGDRLSVALIEAIFSYKFTYQNIICSLSEMVSVPEYKL